MRVLVIGASGQVGAALAAELRARRYTVVGTHARVPQPDTCALDFTDPGATARVVSDVGADCVFEAIRRYGASA